MLRCYRCIVIAAFGWLSLTGAQAPEKQPKAGDSAPQSKTALPTKPAPSNVADAPYRPYAQRYSDACYEAGNHDTADLCAQWRAAIAAEKAAGETRLATIAAIIGTILSLATVIGLIVTIWQTHGALGEARRGNRLNLLFERRARRESRQADLDQMKALAFAERNASAAAQQVEIAREAIIAQNRAWVTYYGTTHDHIRGGMRIEKSDGSIHVVYDSIVLYATWENDGRSPAINIRTYRDYEVLRPGDNPGRFEPEWTSGTPTNTSLGSGKTFATHPMPLTDQEFADFVAGKSKIAVYSRVEYRHVFARPNDPYCISEATKVISFRGWDGAEANPAKRTAQIADANFGDQNICT